MSHPDDHLTAAQHRRAAAITRAAFTEDGRLRDIGPIIEHRMSHEYIAAKVDRQIAARNRSGATRKAAA